MRRTVFKSKIHRAAVTDANLNYEGSLSIDEDLLDAADILPNEQIHVWDVTSGTRLITYALPGPRGSGEICVNGAGAHLIKKGNLVIVATFTTMRTREAKKYEPTVVFVDEKNQIMDRPYLPPEEKPTESTVQAPESKEQSAEATELSASTKRSRRR
jgi:aspartate 1-decarboxylase